MSATPVDPTPVPAEQLADDARPLLGPEGFGDVRIDELAAAFVDDNVGDDLEQFVSWARSQGPVGLDPELGF